MVAYLPLALLALIPVRTITQTREGPPKLSSPMFHGKNAGMVVNLDSDPMACFLNALSRATQHSKLLSSLDPLDLDIKYLVSISLVTTKNRDLVVDFSYNYPECERNEYLQPHFVLSVSLDDGMIRGEKMATRYLKEMLSPVGPQFSLSSDQISSESLAPLILSVFIKSNERVERAHAAGSLDKWSQMTMQDQRETGNRKIVRALRNVLPPGRFDSLLATLPRHVLNTRHSDSESRQSKR
jgi:hypothetical protein